jgi:hypothetical protein
MMEPIRTKQEQQRKRPALDSTSNHSNNNDNGNDQLVQQVVDK